MAVFNPHQTSKLKTLSTNGNLLQFSQIKLTKRVPAGLLAVTCFEVGDFVFNITDQKSSPFISSSVFWEEVGSEVTEKLKAFSEINLMDIEKRKEWS